ncbi:LysM peptidoglycan-binding domain-containing protein [Agromyces sp. NPDC056523]|uniref:LysM peptidoglycan-binding domain-containing protein n=1 Tax=Agromyces sp. NPDC056523 TaxID=3345850 RepID=UPI00366B722A
MDQHLEATSAGRQAGRPDAASRGARRRGIRRLLTLPVAVAGAVAVTLGIVQPAAAAPQTVKRHPKPRAVSGAPVAVEVPSSAAASDVPAEVTVQEGDTVSAIAARYGLSTAEVLAENGLSWSSLIFPGQRLAMPGGTAAASTAPPVPRPEIARHIVRPGDTVSGIAAAYGLDVDVVLSANGLSRASLIFPGQAIVLPAGGDATADAAEPPTVSPPAVESADDEAPAAMLDVHLDDAMRVNARIIVDIGRGLGIPDSGIVIALAVAAQESGLRNLDHGDRDSLGLFQQRPSQGWGTVDDVLDPVHAAAAFYGGPSSPTVGTAPGLLDVPSWSSMTLTDAAQSVQHSGHPEHYAKWEASAQRWLGELG